MMKTIDRNAVAATTALLLALACSAAAADASFDVAWKAALAQPLPDADSYGVALDAYYGSDALVPGRCDRSLEGDHHARLLIEFDADGNLGVRTDSTSEGLAACLVRQLTANPPPIPPRLPMSLAYEFRRSDPKDHEFDAAWNAATDAVGAADAGYRQRLQAFFAAEHAGYADCEYALAEGTGERVLLEFDAHGEFTTRGEGKVTEAQRCLTAVFTEDAPPAPAPPFVIPFRFQRG